MTELGEFLTKMWFNPEQINSGEWIGFFCLLLFVLGIIVAAFVSIKKQFPMGRCVGCGKRTSVKNKNGDAFCYSCKNQDGIARSEELLKGMTRLMNNCNCPKCTKVMTNEVNAKDGPLANSFKMMMNGVTAKSHCEKCNVTVIFSDDDVVELHSTYHEVNKKSKR